MSESPNLVASTRTGTGRRTARRMRREGSDLMPAVIYGGKEAPQLITIQHRDMLKALQDESFQAKILSVTVDDKPVQVILKDIQRHPSQPRVLHADFQRVSADQTLNVRVPLHFVGEELCIGVKQQGGELAHLENEVEVRCRPSDLPEFIEVDVSALEMGDSLHLSDLKLPEGVSCTALSEEHDLPIANVHKARVAEVEEEVEVPADGEAAAPEEEADDEDGATSQD